jgi:capsular polysaccharide transport system permease protein
MQNPDHYRSPLTITLSTWWALFLREALARLSAGRGAWVWLLLEPIFHVVFLLVIFTIIRFRSVGGIDTVVWLVVGLVFFFMFKRTAIQTKNAISANMSLFTYRQVKPVDTIIARGALECFLMALVGLLLAAGASLFGYNFVPNDALTLFWAFINLWLLALGFGLITSIGNILVPELDKIITLAMTPLYMLSGVIIPISAIPDPYRHWLALNPIAHNIEYARISMSSYYHTIPELDFFYPIKIALLGIFIGLLFHNRFASKVSK